ncbi:hypothetical protein JFV28_20185 [Pseudomonas sp. TH05]|uniref:hypothetical protein n=1 Tax=unclassified Pseudomonas TaxID=196821 RepID=UPI0019143373|nr:MULTISPECIES: hypothetical protein [unclassified Pseudomonas]MBK5541557.1 hypothetical protein [Pseudomonas sp. TH07]MBK5558164.1 hypothetical protein [Pseudomonas sp. TH05]
MSNEMISVPRDTLQKWLDDIGPSRHVTQYASLKRDELRALLAKPDADIPASVTGEDVLRWMDEHAAAQPQGEPVHMVRSHGSCCWEEMRGESLELCQAQPGEYEIPKFYTDQPAPAAVVLDGYCIMPRQLTAENGAKALLLGEFKLLVTEECPECCELEEPTEGCSICDGEGDYGQKHTIPWDQIKLIYSKTVAGLVLKAEPAKSR